MWSNATGPNWSELVIKPGGTVVMFAKCSDGVCHEHPDVLKYGYLPYERVRELVERGEITDLICASHLQHGGEKMYGSKKIGCIIVSRGVTREDAKKLHIEYAETPQEAVDRAFARHGSSSRVYLYPSYYYGELLIKKG